MNLPILQTEIKTMSSREIATLCEKEHRSVLRDIDTLNETYEKMGLHKIVQGYYTLENTGSQQHREFLLTKEQSIDLVTGYNRELRIAINRRWQELENQQSTLADLSNPILLRDLLLNYTEKNIALTAENETLTHAIENVTNTGNGIKFQQACKILNVKQPELALWLRDNKWDRWINKARASTAYSQERGYCETKFEEKSGVKATGEPYSYTQIEFFILPKGMAKLAKVFALKEVA